MELLSHLSFAGMLHFQLSENQFLPKRKILIHDSELKPQEGTQHIRKREVQSKKFSDNHCEPKISAHFMAFYSHNPAHEHDRS